MKSYAGTKLIKAKPMTRGVYNEYRGWTIPADENPEDSGYLVSYVDGYESWSPIHIFEEAYREVDGLPFGVAAELMKKGARISRKGWNGQGQFVYYVSEGAYPATMPSVKEILGDALVECRPYMALKTAQGDIVPWTPSQSDVLSDDWCTM